MHELLEIQQKLQWVRSKLRDPNTKNDPVFKILTEAIDSLIDYKHKHEHSTETKVTTTALDVQVGGDHYKRFKIQPVEFITKNELGFCEGNIVKYVTRYQFKNGKQDLEKVKHYVDLLIQLKYEETNETTKESGT